MMEQTLVHMSVTQNEKRCSSYSSHVLPLRFWETEPHRSLILYANVTFSSPTIPFSSEATTIINLVGIQFMNVCVCVYPKQYIL